MTGFMEAYSNALSWYRFEVRLRLTVCEDMTYKQKDHSSHESKCVIFCKNKKGYERLLKISSKVVYRWVFTTP